jgi:hypothetical protein
MLPALVAKAMCGSGMVYNSRCQFASGTSPPCHARVERQTCSGSLYPQPLTAGAQAQAGATCMHNARGLLWLWIMAIPGCAGGHICYMASMHILCYIACLCLCM